MTLSNLTGRLKGGTGVEREERGNFGGGILSLYNPCSEPPCVNPAYTLQSSSKQQIACGSELKADDIEEYILSSCCHSLLFCRVVGLQENLAR